jgi:hypothetical protein
MIVNKPGINTAILAIGNGDYSRTDEIIARMSRMERVKKGRKREARDKKLGKPWGKASLKERARFDSRFEYDEKRRAYVRRKKPKDYNELLKSMKKRSIEFKRKAKRMGKRASKMKKRYSPIYTSTVLAAEGHRGLFVDISTMEDPKDILSMILYKASAKPLSADAAKGLNKYYSRPLAINAYMFSKEPILIITEDDGLYTFEGSAAILAKIKKAFIRATKSEAEPAQFENIKFDSKHLEFVAKIFNEMGGESVSYFVVSAYEPRTAKKVITQLKRAIALFFKYASLLEGDAKKKKKLNRWVTSLDAGKINKATQRDYEKKYTAIVKQLKSFAKSDQKGLVTKSTKILKVLDNKAMKKEFMAMIKETLKVPTPKKEKVLKRSRRKREINPSVAARTVLEDLFEDTVTEKNVKQLIYLKKKTLVKVWAEKGKFKNVSVTVKAKDTKYWRLTLDEFTEALDSLGAKSSLVSKEEPSSASKKPKKETLFTPVPMKSLRGTGIIERTIELFLQKIEKRPRQTFTYTDMSKHFGISLDKVSKIVKELKKFNKASPLNAEEWTVGPKGSVTVPKSSTRHKVPKKVKTPDKRTKTDLSLWAKVKKENPSYEEGGLYFSKGYQRKVGKYNMQKMIHFKTLTENKIRIELGKMSKENVYSFAVSIPILMAAVHRNRDVRGNILWYFFAKELKKITEDVLGDKRQKEAKEGKKEPGTFYEGDMKFSGSETKYGTVMINDVEDGPMKEYKATLIGMSGGKRGIAIQEKRFNVGDKIKLLDKRYGGYKYVTIESHKYESSKQGGSLHRYYYGQKAWFRDFFEEGKNWVVKVK